jgi:hypothetical protein
VRGSGGSHSSEPRRDRRRRRDPAAGKRRPEALLRQPRGHRRRVDTARHQLGGDPAQGPDELRLGADLERAERTATRRRRSGRPSGARHGTSSQSMSEAAQAALIRAGLRQPKAWSWAGPSFVYSVRDSARTSATGSRTSVFCATTGRRSRRTRRFEAWRLRTTEQREAPAEAAEHVSERRPAAPLPERAPAAEAAREQAAMQGRPAARHALELARNRVAGAEELDEVVPARRLRLVHVPLLCPLTRAAAPLSL